MKRFTILFAAVLVLSVVAPAGPAHAESPAGFNFTTQFGGASLNNNPGGRAEIDGQITFLSKRKIEVDLWQLKDRCNPAGRNDGFGAYAAIGAHLLYTDSNIVSVGGPKYGYFNLCDQGFAYIYNDPYTAPAGAVITDVVVSLQECSQNQGCGWTARDNAASRSMDNPFV